MDRWPNLCRLELAKATGHLDGNALLAHRALDSPFDHADLRRCFEGMLIEWLDIAYTVGGGGKAVDRRELVIWSWDPQEDPAGLF